MSEATASSSNKRAQTVAALEQIRNRAAVLPPTIDFTVHVGDDGQTFSTTERVVKEVQAPAFFKPTDEQFYHDETKTKPDIAFLKNHFYREGRLTDEQVSYLSAVMELRDRRCQRCARGASAFSSSPGNGDCSLTKDPCERLQAIFILTEASKVLRAESNLLEVDAPITGECFRERQRRRGWEERPPHRTSSSCYK